MVSRALRGRPIVQKKQDQKKSKILAAANKLLCVKSFRDITIRELADEAEVNSAMIGYYFKNKDGLFISLLDQMSQQFFKKMQVISKSSNPLKTFIEMNIQEFSENRGLARLVHDELMATEDQANHEFINRFPKKMAKVLPQLILDNTAVTDALIAKYRAFSLIMLIVSPFISAPVRKSAWGITDTELQGPLWSEQLYTLFMLGCSKEIN